MNKLIVSMLAGLCCIPVQGQLDGSKALQKAREQLGRMGVAENSIELVPKSAYRDDHNGVEHHFFVQTIQGLEVFGADVAIHLASDGRVLAFNERVVRDLDPGKVNVSPSLSGADAFRVVKDRLGLSDWQVVQRSAEARNVVFDAQGRSAEDPRSTLMLQRVDDQVLLVWNVEIYMPDGSHWWNIRVNANDGRELDRNDWVVNCAFHPDEEDEHPAAPSDYRVFGMPVESPLHGPIGLENAPWTVAPNASPFGWHDTDGTPGAEFTITRGNNVYASEDRNNDNVPGHSPDGGSSLDFDFPFDPALEPIDNEDVAITNLFYWNNIIHDVMYQYGFDEASGNFQENNYGNGGVGSDAVNADAQDGSGTNNANFGTPADGSNPRMQMFRWTYTTPNRDSDLDNGIIVHEYGHGISNRLVGGPLNTSCLGNSEQMGEGWSDYFGLIMTMEPGDQGTDARGIGNYVLGQGLAGGGIRPAPYSTDFGVNAFTYASTNSGLSQPHGIGFVWCTMLWEMTWDLIAQYGFDPDIYNGTGGNNIALQLVIDGLKLTACNPGFVDGRDAILLADQINNGGANQDLIWSAFARRGLGFSASQGSSTSRSDQTEAFDVPLDVNVGVNAVIEPSAGVYYDCANGSRIVNVEIRNNGLTPQGNFQVRYRLDGGGAVSELFTGSLPSGGATQLSFSVPLTISGAGIHNLEVWTELAGDQDLSNDTLAVQLELLAGSVLTTPFQEDLESASSCSTASNCGATSCPLPNGWLNLANGVYDDIDWRVDAGGTPSSGTGPSVDLLPGTSGGQYIYLEASGGCTGREAVLLSPCLDLSGVTLPRLRYGYHMAGVDVGELHVDLFDGSAWQLDIAPPLSGSQGLQWNTSIVYLDAYAGGTVVIRFRGVTGPDFSSDIALDALEIFDGAVPPVVDFDADPVDWCDGGPVQFEDVSINDPTTWLWTFAPPNVQFVDGTTASSEAPKVVFTQPGQYTVTLDASNAYGSSSLTRTDLITMGDDEPVTMHVWTDAWGGETSWMIRSLGGDTVLTGGGYPTTSVFGVNEQDPVRSCLERDTCYILEVNDTYGDGMCCAYGAGKYVLANGAGDTLVFGDGQFTFQRLDTFCMASPAPAIQARGLLQGAYDSVTGLMRDDIRSAGALPLSEPYTGAGFAQPTGGGETLDPALLSLAGPDALVDWVRLELRDPLDPSVVVAAVQALVQRDGDVVDGAGNSAVALPVTQGSYYLALRHRNHLGCMTASTVELNGTVDVDF
ncbi:MAG: M36 family metallopeptidase, partial [Flavobacteriales bacterium]|nr:M36 family metallopeptidase [Flavobacteriales bacterium]